MNVVFFGTPEYVIPVAEGLHKNFNLAAVVTTPDRPAGRNHVMTSPPIKVWAEANNIPVFQPQNLNTAGYDPSKLADGLVSQLLALSPHLFVVASYGKIIPQMLLNIPEFGALNIHPSRLPELRGPTPIQTAILQGQYNSAVTIIKMDEKMDHGPIIFTIFFCIHRDETFLAAVTRAFAEGADYLPDIIPRYTSGFLEPGEQDESRATYCKHITKQDGYIDLDSPPTPEQFDRMVRAYYPWPNVWTKVNINNQDKRIKFLPEQKIQLEGKKPVDKQTFCRGYPELKETLEKLYKENNQISK